VKKRLITLLLLYALSALICSPTVFGASNVTVYISEDNGATLTQISFPDVHPTIINDRVLIPVRGLFENLGCSVSWEQRSSTAIVKNQFKTVKIPVGSQHILVNDQKIDTSVPAQIINSRTMIPIRAVSEALDLEVQWNAQKRSVIIHANSANTINPSTYNNFGSAAFIRDKTVIVSIFASDTETSWNFSQKEDNMLATETLNNLSIAVDWLSENTETYNVKAEFVYDWAKNSDLVYSVQFHQSLITANGKHYTDQVNYIDQYVDSEGLLNKYNAKNIIYMFFFNTPFSNQHNPWSLPKEPNNNCKTEIINIFHRFDDEFTAQPSIYAHEIMHCFGAKDLYYKNTYIPQSYVDHCTQNSNDIMFTVGTTKKIYQDFTRLDAYYMGLINSCSEVSTWNLKESDYITLQR